MTETPAEESQPTTADGWKEKGNKLFKQNKYSPAIFCYDQAIQIAPTAPLYSNRALCELRLENFGTVIENCTKAIELDPNFIKAYFRRGSAYAQLKRLDKAIADFKQVIQIDPQNRDARAKLGECTREQKAQLLFEALKVDVISSADKVKKSLSTMSVSPSYTGPQFTFPLNSETVARSFITETVPNYLRSQHLLPIKYLLQLLLQTKDVLSSEPNVLTVPMPDEGVTIVGDVHGQFYDLLHIFDISGYPSEHNIYVFNGDYVDRGSFSMEIITLLFLLKICYPKFIILLRGNHESRNMNDMYGFKGECTKRYKESELYGLFTEVFNCLPLACILTDEPSFDVSTPAGLEERDTQCTRVMCIHGGIPSFAYSPS